MSDAKPSEDPYAKELLLDTELPKEVQQYLDVRVQARYAERTYFNRRSTYRHYQRFCELFGIDFLDPSVTDVEDFIDHQLNSGYSKGTVENRVYDLSSVFQYLSKRGHVDSNPIDEKHFDMEVVRSASDFGEIRYIEINDYEKLKDSIEKLRDRLLVVCLWQTGVRAKEAVNITLEDINREKQEIEVETVKQREENVTRTVYYKRSFEHLLTKWLDRGGRDKFLSASDSDYLFVGKESPQLNPRRPTEIIREYADEAGIQAITSENRVGQERRAVTAHAFRHSFAVHRVRNGMPIVFLSELLGHSDIQQTREYLKFRNEDVREAEERYRP